MADQAIKLFRHIMLFAIQYPDHPNILIRDILQIL